MATYNYQSGLGNASAYQVSGIPYVSGNLSVASGAIMLEFPRVTSWVQVNNTGGDEQDLAIGFSEAGVSNSNKYVLLEGQSTGKLELKVTEIHFSGTSDEFSVIAGLTSILTEQIDLSKQLSPSGSNWSGSLIAQVG